MPRAPRIEYEGAVYHVMSRGVKRERIFMDRGDYEMFMVTLEEVCERAGWRVHAFVLLSNHYHGLIETPEANLVAGMKWFQGAFAQRFNARHRQRGHVFQGRYKALIIDADSGAYFETVSTYIHLNPVRAGLIREENGGLKSYPWSSYPLYCKPKRHRPQWLAVDRVLGNLGLVDNRRGQAAYEAYLTQRVWDMQNRKMRKELEKEWKAIRRGWYLGEETFKERLLEKLSGVLSGRDRASYSGEAVQRHDEREAERLIQAGMHVLNLTEADFDSLPKGEIRKCALAWLAHSRTTVRHAWLAEQLRMGCPSNMTVYLDRVQKATSPSAARLCNRLRRAVGNA